MPLVGGKALVSCDDISRRGLPSTRELLRIGGSGGSPRASRWAFVSRDVRVTPTPSAEAPAMRETKTARTLIACRVRRAGTCKGGSDETKWREQSLTNKDTR